MKKTNPRLLTLMGLIAVAAPGCGDGQDVEHNDILLTRSDGTQVAYERLEGAVWCGPWESGSEGPQTLHILIGRSRDALAEAAEEAKKDDEAQTAAKVPSHWRLTAVADKLKVGEASAFPQSRPYPEPTDVRLFAYDSETGNEASTAEGESSGALTFRSAGCSPTTLIEFDIDAVLGSELGDHAPLSMKGTFRGRVAEKAPF